MFATCERAKVEGGLSHLTLNDAVQATASSSSNNNNVNTEAENEAPPSSTTMMMMMLGSDAPTGYDKGETATVDGVSNARSSASPPAMRRLYYNEDEDAAAVENAAAVPRPKSHHHKRDSDFVYDCEGTAEGNAKEEDDVFDSGDEHGINVTAAARTKVCDQAPLLRKRVGRDRGGGDVNSKSRASGPAKERSSTGRARGGAPKQLHRPTTAGVGATHKSPGAANRRTGVVSPSTRSAPRVELSRKVQYPTERQTSAADAHRRAALLPPRAHQGAPTSAAAATTSTRRTASLNANNTKPSSASRSGGVRVLTTRGGARAAVGDGGSSSKAPSATDATRPRNASLHHARGRTSSSSGAPAKPIRTASAASALVAASSTQQNHLAAQRNRGTTLPFSSASRPLQRHATGCRSASASAASAAAAGPTSRRPLQGFTRSSTLRATGTTTDAIFRRTRTSTLIATGTGYTSNGMTELRRYGSASAGFVSSSNNNNSIASGSGVGAPGYCGRRAPTAPAPASRLSRTGTQTRCSSNNNIKTRHTNTERVRKNERMHGSTSSVLGQSLYRTTSSSRTLQRMATTTTAICSSHCGADAKRKLLKSPSPRVGGRGGVFPSSSAATRTAQARTPELMRRTRSSAAYGGVSGGYTRTQSAFPRLTASCGAATSPSAAAWGGGGASRRRLLPPSGARGGGGVGMSKYAGGSSGAATVMQRSRSAPSKLAVGSVVQRGTLCAGRHGGGRRDGRSFQAPPQPLLPNSSSSGQAGGKNFSRSNYSCGSYNPVADRLGRSPQQQQQQSLYRSSSGTKMKTMPSRRRVMPSAPSPSSTPSHGSNSRKSGPGRDVRGSATLPLHSMCPNTTNNTDSVKGRPSNNHISNKGMTHLHHELNENLLPGDGGTAVEGCARSSLGKRPVITASSANTTTTASASSTATAPYEGAMIEGGSRSTTAASSSKMRKSASGRGTSFTSTEPRISLGDGGSDGVHLGQRENDERVCSTASCTYSQPLCTVFDVDTAAAAAALPPILREYEEFVAEVAQLGGAEWRCLGTILRAIELDQQQQLRLEEEVAHDAAHLIPDAVSPNPRVLGGEALEKEKEVIYDGLKVYHADGDSFVVSLSRRSSPNASGSTFSSLHTRPQQQQQQQQSQQPRSPQKMMSIPPISAPRGATESGTHLADDEMLMVVITRHASRSTLPSSSSLPPVAVGANNSIADVPAHGDGHGSNSERGTRRKNKCVSTTGESTSLPTYTQLTRLEEAEALLENSPDVNAPPPRYREKKSVFHLGPSDATPSPSPSPLPTMPAEYYDEYHNGVMNGNNDKLAAAASGLKQVPPLDFSSIHEYNSHSAAAADDVSSSMNHNDDDDYVEEEERSVSWEDYMYQYRQEKETPLEKLRRVRLAATNKVTLAAQQRRRASLGRSDSLRRNAAIVAAAAAAASCSSEGYLGKVIAPSPPLPTGASGVTTNALEPHVVYMTAGRLNHLLEFVKKRSKSR